eukprot:4641563-Amphidinium_carterae.1
MSSVNVYQGLHGDKYVPKVVATTAISFAVLPGSVCCRPHSHCTSLPSKEVFQLLLQARQARLSRNGYRA